MFWQYVTRATRATSSQQYTLLPRYDIMEIHTSHTHTELAQKKKKMGHFTYSTNPNSQHSTQETHQSDAKTPSIISISCGPMRS